MIDIEAYLKDKPGRPIDKEAAECFRVVYDSLNTSFTTEYSHIDSVAEDEDGVCLSIVYCTPYLSTDTKDRKRHLANLFRLADSISIAPVPDSDGFLVAVIFAFALWR